mmetsp:Transcript_57251/g.167554  ORF Transcript_57251/g.167554 Transcript_57251/m.167554 type:complete len:115 (-) Transcript_57251:393-737(-)
MTGPAKQRCPPGASSTSMSKRLRVVHRGWWMVEKVVHCSEAAHPRTTSSMRCAVAASRPVDGSSKSRILGFDTSSMPIEARFRWPPERPSLMARSATCARPSPSMIASTRALSF